MVKTPIFFHWGKLTPFLPSEVTCRIDTGVSKQTPTSKQVNFEVQSILSLFCHTQQNLHPRLTTWQTTASVCNHMYLSIKVILVLTLSLIQFFTF